MPSPFNPHRRQVLRLCLAAAALSFGAARTSNAGADPMSEQVLIAVNRQRAAHALWPLRLDSRLVRVASRHASELLHRGVLDHVGRDGSNLRDRLARAKFRHAVAGENLASGPESAEETVRLWMESAPHRRNILYPGFSVAGAARVAEPDPRLLIGYQYYWTLVLAHPA